MLKFIDLVAQLDALNRYVEKVQRLETRFAIATVRNLVSEYELAEEELLHLVSKGHCLCEVKVSGDRIYLGWDR